MKDKQAVQIDTRQEIHLILNTREGHFEKLDRLDSLFKQKLKEQEVLLEACKAENEKLKDQINSMEYAIVRWTDNEYEDVVCINKEVAEEYVKKYSDLAGLGKCYVDKDIYLPLREA